MKILFSFILLASITAHAKGNTDIGSTSIAQTALESGEFNKTSCKVICSVNPANALSASEKAEACQDNMSSTLVILRNQDQSLIFGNEQTAKISAAVSLPAYRMGSHAEKNLRYSLTKNALVAVNKSDFGDYTEKLMAGEDGSVRYNFISTYRYTKSATITKNATCTYSR